jgi:hypothetical protein
VELVNSPDKGNQNIEAFSEAKVTADGEKTIWSVNAGAPGAPNTTSNSFLARRGEGGWSSQALAPEAAQQYGGGNFISKVTTASPDLAHFLAVYSNPPELAIARFDQSRNEELLRTYSTEEGLDKNGIELNDDGSQAIALNLETHQLEEIGNGPPQMLSIMPDGEESSCGLEGGGKSFGGINEGVIGAASLWLPGYRMIATADRASRVYFQAKPNKASDPSKCQDTGLLGLYVRNREASKGKGKTTPIDPGTGEEPHFITASPDGRQAYFTTFSKLDPADTNAHEDVYRWDEAEGKSSCLTCAAAADINPLRKNGEKPAKILLSRDLSHVYFQSKEQLTPEASAGHVSVYVLSGGETRFVADTNNGEGAPLGEAQLSADGRALVFRAKANPGLTADPVASPCAARGEADACAEIYRYDDRDGSLECISCRRGGLTSHAATEAQLSSDGSTVVFTTEEALVGADVNDDADVYEWRGGRPSLITDGVSDFPEGFAAPRARAVDGDGSDIFFAVGAPGLTGYEQDGVGNLYDARIGGGFPPPTPPTHCNEDDCQGPLQPAPPLDRPATTLSGRGNDKGGRPSRCAKGKTRRHRRCVGRHHKRKHRRGANHRGRGR